MWLHSFSCQGQAWVQQTSVIRQETEKNLGFNGETHITYEKLQRNRLAKPANQAELKTTLV